MTYRTARAAMITGAALTLCACVGGGGSIYSTPPAPIAPPTPTPTPMATPFGVTSDTQFPTVGDKVDIRWNSSAQTYEIRLSEKDWKRLTLGYTNSTVDEHYPASGLYGVRIQKDLPYAYTKYATVFENGWGAILDEFAFGLPTATGDVPKTGSASYDAKVWGTGTGAGAVAGSGTYYDVTGMAKLSFDFGAGSLSGYMTTTLTGPTGIFTTPRYDFTQTVYAAGSTTFSGNFIVPGSSEDAYFSGQFNGPQAAELMASWRAPFADPTAPNGPLWGTMRGVWIGKKD